MTIERMLIGTADAAGDPYFSNVSLLLHGDGTNGAQNNTFLDSSSNNFTITRNGNTTQGAFSPFPLNGAAYNPAVNGGSGYFDGSGDRLVIADAAQLNFSGDFTIELWVYATAISSIFNIIITKGDAVASNEWSIDFYSSKITFYAGGFQLDSINTATVNTWYHVAVTRSGSTVRLFVDGILQSSGTSSVNYTSTRNLAIGDREAGSAYLQYPMTGYISSLRIVKGAAVYTSNFTPPTAPLTAISGTSLLCNFTNAGIYDNAAKNDLETVGNAQVSTAVKKYGTGSMYFDGNGDYLTIPYSTELKLSSGDWTIEFWIYCTGAQSSANNAIWLQDITGSNYTGIVITANSSRQVQFTSSQTGSSWTYLFQTIGTYSDNTWSHVAICKSNTTVYGFFNGNKNLTISGFPSTIFSSSDPSAIGVYAANYFNGYIDEFRITKGVARYTANFTPPTQAFPNY